MICLQAVSLLKRAGRQKKMSKENGKQKGINTLNESKLDNIMQNVMASLHAQVPLYMKEKAYDALKVSTRELLAVPGSTNRIVQFFGTVEQFSRSIPWNNFLKQQRPGELLRAKCWALKEGERNVWIRLEWYQTNLDMLANVAQLPSHAALMIPVSTDKPLKELTNFLAQYCWKEQEVPAEI